MLPKAHHLTVLVIRNAHHNTLHGCVQLILSQAVKLILRRCVTCCKHCPSPLSKGKKKCVQWVKVRVPALRWKCRSAAFTCSGATARGFQRAAQGLTCLRTWRQTHREFQKASRLTSRFLGNQAAARNTLLSDSRWRVNIVVAPSLQPPTLCAALRSAGLSSVAQRQQIQLIAGQAGKCSLPWYI